MHISADSLSFSDLNPELVFVGDLLADCIVLHNTGSLLYEEMCRLSLALLSQCRCVITELETVEELAFYETLHASLNQGTSVIAAVSAATTQHPGAPIQCHGYDWLPRQPNYVAGVRVFLRSAPETCCAVRGLLEIVDKIRTGFNRDGPLTLQQDISETTVGWEEIMLSLGARIHQNQIIFDRGGEEVPLETDAIRTLLTALLDCGEVLCREIVGLLLKDSQSAGGAEPPHVLQIVELLELYVSTTPDNSSSPPRLPLPGDVYQATQHLLTAIGLNNTGQLVNGNVLLSGETSFLRVEASLYLLKTLFDLGSAPEPYYNPPDDVGAIEI